MRSIVHTGAEFRMLKVFEENSLIVFWAGSGFGGWVGRPCGCNLLDAAYSSVVKLYLLLDSHSFNIKEWDGGSLHMHPSL